MTPNENKMSDGGRGRAARSESMEVISNLNAGRSAVRSIAWLDVLVIALSGMLS